VQLTDHLSFGFAPTIDLGFLEADPAFIVAPNIVNGFPEYPPGTHTETQWGAGFQLGLYYALQDWQFGSSFKSPQWFEPFRFDSVNAAGGPRTIKFDFDYPMILSEGIAYSGFENWLLTADLRYIDYRNTEGFRDRGFDATGAARGLGWDSIWGVSAGAQYRLTDFLTLRAGYSYNENPIDNIETSFNVASPVIIEHTLYVGASYRVSDNLILSAAYAHAFQNSITGPLLQPTGPIPGYNVTSTISADTFLFGATVQFGPRCSSPTGSPVAFSGSAN